MTWIRVDAEEVAALGQGMVEVAESLRAGESLEADRWAMGGGESADALQDLVEHWQRYRTSVAETLHSLGAMAQQAGAGYVETEAGVTRAFAGDAR